MRLATYDAIVARAERSAASAPAKYRLWVRFFSGIGFLVASLALLGGIILTLSAIAILVFGWFKGKDSETILKAAAFAGFFGVSLTWSVAKSFIVGFPPAEGVTLTKADAGELFDEVERLRRSMQVPPVHRIVLTDELNAALYQRPRLGIFGWYENTLILGLPLLRQFTVDQMRSVIVHELGHLAGEHGRTGAKIYRLRQTWQTLLDRGGSKLLGRFMQWYVPRFNAFTFVLGRMQEREADRLAAELCSASAAGSALVRIRLLGRVHQHFWDRLSVMAANEPDIPNDIHVRLDRALANPPAEARRWIREELTRQNNRIDTHPCLRERLAIVGYHYRDGIPLGPTSGSSAADAWLEDQHALGASFDKRWQHDNEDQWSRAHNSGRQLSERRTALEKAQQNGDLDEDDQWELVMLIHHFDGAHATRPALVNFIALHPTHAGALFRLGADLLDEGDAHGVAFIEAAMAIDPDATGPGNSLLRDFADAYGNRELLSAAEDRLEQRADLENEADSERSAIPALDALQAHDLNSAQVDALVENLQRVEAVAAIDVARVVVQYLSHNPHYIVVVQVSVSWWKFREEDADQKLVSELMQHLRLPGSGLVVLANQHAAVAKAVSALPQARVFTRA